ncbi:hypothetical protein CBF23_010510 [Marinomonas agarivorans]|nr:hypothetical protein CBF23_010510 [Marinomonas agarivorans]
MNNKLYLLLTLTCLPVIFFASQYASKFVLPTQDQAELLAIENCEFGVRVCVTSFQEQDILIATENSLTTDEPIQIRIATNTKEIAHQFARVELVLQGKTMYMGVVQTPLKLVEDVWQGELYIPFCTTEKMDWLLTANFFTHSGQQLQTNIEFQISHS